MAFYQCNQSNIGGMPIEYYYPPSNAFQGYLTFVDGVLENNIKVINTSRTGAILALTEPPKSFVAKVGIYYYEGGTSYAIL